MISETERESSIPVNLAIGIGIQNFPEGLAVSLPLQAAGFSVWRAFWSAESATSYFLRRRTTTVASRECARAAAATPLGRMPTQPD
ncbi:Zinc transporter ZIP11 [Eumeta japonica]|uniref:Zinc transporter ZIP11 n=1 Tax=Eumeta variegata TaxID=151549 RepID=A0A4C1YG47_EUMVA|nr:Zinc transporter ZIP11 [Eumeta japonica]